MRGSRGGGTGGPDPPPPWNLKILTKKDNFWIFLGIGAPPPRLRQYFTILVGPPLVKCLDPSMKVIQASSFYQIMMGWSHRCYIPIFVKIGLPALVKKIFSGFSHIWAWRPSWSCNLDFTNKLSFPLPIIDAPHKISL